MAVEATAIHGKRIYELEQVIALSNTSEFVITNEDHLTRKVSLIDLRKSFNGDNATTDLDNKYYSINKIEELFDQVYARLRNCETSGGDVTGDLNSFKDEINNQINNLYLDLNSKYNELVNADSNTNKRIDDLSKKVDNNFTTLSNKITDLDNKYLAKVNDLSSKVTDLSGKVNSLSNRVTELSNTIESGNIGGGNTGGNTGGSSGGNEDTGGSTEPSIDPAEITKLNERCAKIEANVSALSQTHSTDITNIKNSIKDLTNKFHISDTAPTTLESGHIWFQYF